MKKKKKNALKTVLCSCLMLTLFSATIVFANDVTPALTSFLKEDYVYVSSFDGDDYTKTVPVFKDGTYYLPLREFLNNCSIENDKIMYNNGKITVDVWSNGMTVHMGDGVSYNMSGGYSWSTGCLIGEKEFDIAGEKHTLSNAPYLEGGITYVPYEYIRLLKRYEDFMGFDEIREGEQYKRTSKFVSVMLFGYDSMESRYYSDGVSLTNLYSSFTEEPIDDLVHSITASSWNEVGGTMAEIKRTGYRTELNISAKFIDMNNPESSADIEVALNKVTRIYGRGSDLEGIFTVKLNGKILYDNKEGYITNLPLKAGEGVADLSETRISVEDIGLRIFFNGFGSETLEAYSTKSSNNSKIYYMPDTVVRLLHPTEVKLNGISVARASNYNVFSYNIANAYSSFRVEFNDHNGERYTDRYRIYQNADCEAHFIDENTFSAYFQLEKNDLRIDSFEAIVTLLPNNQFEFKSNDGRYIVKGTTAEFVPMWDWTAEQKRAPLPTVQIIK